MSSSVRTSPLAVVNLVISGSRNAFGTIAQSTPATYRLSRKLEHCRYSLPLSLPLFATLPWSGNFKQTLSPSELGLLDPLATPAARTSPLRSAINLKLSYGHLNEIQCLARLV